MDFRNSLLGNHRATLQCPSSTVLVEETQLRCNRHISGSYVNDSGKKKKMSTLERRQDAELVDRNRLVHSAQTLVNCTGP